MPTHQQSILILSLSKDDPGPAPGDDGFHWSELDRDWLNWSPEQYIDTIDAHPRAADGFAKDKAALDWADTCVLLLPSGRSAHLEAGYLAGQGKPVAVLVRPEGFEPELMYLLCERRFATIEELDVWLSMNCPAQSILQTLNADR